MPKTSAKPQRQARHQCDVERASGMAKPNPPLSQEIEDQIRTGMARALWVFAYMRWVEENAADDYDRTQDWDEVTPITPGAADQAAQDLVALIALNEGIADESAVMSNLFALAAEVDTGEMLQMDPSALYNQELQVVLDKLERGEIVPAPLVVQAENAPTIADVANGFGFSIAAQCLGEGIGWGDHHRERRGVGAKMIEFKPRLPRFECDFDGDELSWSGAADSARRTGREEAESPSVHREWRTHVIDADLNVPLPDWEGNPPLSVIPLTTDDAPSLVDAAVRVIHDELTTHGGRVESNFLGSYKTLQQGPQRELYYYDADENADAQDGDAVTDHRLIPKGLPWRDQVRIWRALMGGDS